MDVTDLGVKFDEQYRERIESMSWHISRHGYPRTFLPTEGRGVRVMALHRLVWAWEYGWKTVPKFIDHINGDRRDARLQNLRPTTLSLNAHNARKRARALPRGVVRNGESARNPFAANICHRGNRIHLGVFPTAEEASVAYEAARDRIVTHEALIAVGLEPVPVKIETRSRKRGRRPLPLNEKAVAMYRAGIPLSKIAAEIGCDWRTVRRMFLVAGVLDGSPPAGMMDACPAPKPEETRRDYRNSGRKRGSRANAAADPERQDDGDLLGGLDGSERRADDVGGGDRLRRTGGDGVRDPEEGGSGDGDGEAGGRGVREEGRIEGLLAEDDG